MGIVLAVMLTGRIGRIRLQVFGFIGCAVGLFIATLSLDTEGNARMLLIVTGFMLFSLMTNLGPNAQT